MWEQEELMFALLSHPDGRPLPTSVPLFTAQHVLWELANQGRHPSLESIAQLAQFGAVISREFGDPFLVGDNTIGAVALVSPNGMQGAILRTPHSTSLNWTDPRASGYRETIRALLSFAAPMTFAPMPNMGLSADDQAALERAIDLGLPAETILAVNVGAVQAWAEQVSEDPANLPAPGRFPSSFTNIEPRALRTALANLREDAEQQSTRRPQVRREPNRSTQRGNPSLN